MNKFTRYSIATLTSIFLLTGLSGCDSPQSSRGHASGDSDQLKGTISLSGAFALYPLANIWAEEFSKIHPDVRFNISAGGAGKGMSDALSGMVDLGMFSREVKEEEKQKGAWWIAVSRDAVLPTVNAANPVWATLKETGLSRDEFEAIFITQTITTWGQATGSPSQEKINVYTRSDAAGAAEIWALYAGGQSQESLKGLGVYGDPGLAEALKKDRNGIGFNNIIYVYDLHGKQKYEGIEVIPIDIDNNGKMDENEKFYDNLNTLTAAIAEGEYPSPPARELYFVSKGKPENKAIILFLEWVLTEGQKYVPEAGYIQLTRENIESELAKLQLK